MVKFESLKKATNSKKFKENFIQIVFLFLLQKTFMFQDKNQSLISFVMKKKLKGQKKQNKNKIKSNCSKLIKKVAQ